MGFLNILTTVAAECGYDKTDAGERAYLTEKINEAARDIYQARDLPVALKECYVRVTPNNECSLPPFIGELRAIRPGSKDYCSTKWVLHTMYPRYNRSQWETDWKNWRDKGTAATAIEFNNTAALEITIAVADSELIVTVVGENDDSNNVVDSVTMDAVSKDLTASFVRVNRIYKNKRTNHNVIIKDADGNEIAIIYADQTEARYKIVDISEYPNACCGTNSCGDGTYIMEVLYKPILPILKEDHDFFPVDGYDDVVVLKTKQLLMELEEGKEQRVLLLENKVEKKQRQIFGHKQGTSKQKLTRKANPTFRGSGYYR